MGNLVDYWENDSLTLQTRFFKHLFVGKFGQFVHTFRMLANNINKVTQTKWHCQS